MSSNTYYFRLWKHHCCMFLISLVLISNGIIWSVVFAWVEMAKTSIAFALAAAFGMFMAKIEYSQCGYYHARYKNSTCAKQP